MSKSKLDMYLGLGSQDGVKESLFEDAQIFEGRDFECSKAQRKTRCEG
jgi:hypothetical protein